MKPTMQEKVYYMNQYIVEDCVALVLSKSQEFTKDDVTKDFQNAIILLSWEEFVEQFPPAKEIKEKIIQEQCNGGKGLSLRKYFV